MDFTYRPTSRLLSPAEIQAERDQAIAGKQRNALMALQLQGAQEERAAAQRNALLMQQFRDSIPSPEMGAAQNALMGGGGPTVANAAKIQPVDPRLAFADKAFRAGAMAPGDYMNMRFPQAQPKTIKSDETLIEYTPGQAPRTVIQGAPKAADIPGSVREYQFAKTQGYSGSYEQWVKEKASAGATRVNVPVNTERTYAGNIADALAKQDTDVIDSGRSAPERIRAARQVKQLLQEQPITGTLAEQRLAISRALATAGVISEDSAAATETLAAGLASQALAAIKSSGLGAGSGFSNADRDFLERASAGKIDMTPGAIARIADLNEKAGLRAIERANKVIGRLQGNQQLGPSVRGALEQIQAPGEIRLPTAAEIQAEIARRQGGR